MTADIFDVFDEHPEVVAVPLEQALRNFRQHYGPAYAAYVDENRQAIADGRSTVESRKAARDWWFATSERVHLQLFRSVMAAGQEPSA